MNAAHRVGQVRLSAAAATDSLINESSTGAIYSIYSARSSAS